MKQRLTYLLPSGTGVEKSDLKIGNDSLDFSKAHQSSEEWRITLGLRELPDELQSILKECHELHLRWSSQLNHDLVPPLVSRLPPGLHVFFTPRTGVAHVPLCDLLERLLENEAKCVSVQENFARISITSERFAQTSTFQWHQFSPIRSSSLYKAILEKICATGWTDASLDDPCVSLVPELDHASHVDIDFDAISHALVLTAYWPITLADKSGDNSKRALRQYRKAEVDDRLEVGVLQVEKADHVEKLSLGGYLTVVGEDDHPGQTLFSFPSRHHPLPTNSPATFTASFQQPTGLHPKLHINLPRRHLIPPKESCALHTYMTLPSALFVDRYQLSDRLFLDSQNLVALHSLAGEHDLEAPDWVTSGWGSASLLQLAIPSSAPKSTASATNDDNNWTVTIPLHLRYIDSPQRATDRRHEATFEVPWPILFWACEAEEGLKMSTNPFDRVNLGYEGLFGPKTMFYHIPPASNATMLVEEITVPILNAENHDLVQVGTLLVVVIGFVWVCGQLFKTTNLGGRKGSSDKKGQ